MPSTGSPALPRHDDRGQRLAHHLDAKNGSPTAVLEALLEEEVEATRARLVAERRVDVIIAQGTEAGGFTGAQSTTTLAPQVVDAVSPIPLVAAGGIADGRGLAAAYCS